MHEHIKEHMRYSLHECRPQPFQNMPMKLDTICSRTRFTAVLTHIDILVGLKTEVILKTSI